jgi:hypothetical protein
MNVNIHTRIKSAYQIVTSQLPVLVPCGANERDGIAPTGMNKSCYVRVVSSSELNPKGLRYKRAAVCGALSEKEWKRLRGIKMLKNAHERGDPRAARQAYEMLAEYLYPPPTSREQEAANWLALNYTDPEKPLAALLTKDLLYVRIIYWNVGKGNTVVVTPGIFCPDYKTAINVKMILEQDVRVCPWCHNMFVAKRPKQHCCSIECREAHRVARWREKQKKEN